MADMEQLRQIYSRYQEEIDKAYKKAGLLDGIWGMGNDPRQHPCNAAFYEQTEQWAAAFVKQQPDQAEMLEAVKWILEAADRNRDAKSYWYFYVVHNHVMQMVPMLSPGDCAELSRWYDSTYPKRERLPNHEKLYKQLCKRAKAK